MSLASLLKRDVAGRQKQVKVSQRLIAHWEHELAHPPRPAVPVDHSKPVPRSGIDFAFGKPAPAKLRAAGVTFVCRYLGGESTALTRGEAEDYSSGDIDIVTVFERTANRSLAGYDQGVTDAKLAKDELKALGAPAHAVAYFAVDFDMTPAQAAAVSEYFRGAVHVLGWDRVGIYGGLRAVNHVLALNRCKYGWQTYAWSDGKWCSRAQLRQVHNGDRVAGVEADLDTAVAGDFGQWQV